MTTFRQHTRTIVTVHSHVNSADRSKDSGAMYDISADVISVQTQKTTKAMGKWSVTLVPRKNYLNFIYPNDIVNIYIDPGDGERGFVRVMMGYVDRIERIEQTDANGSTKTAFQLVGSDFQKAIDKTHIYFNAYMRTILDERFARSDQGKLSATFANGALGAGLRNAGLTVFGTPADFIENFLLILLGFGQQWTLPASYGSARKSLDMNRRLRVQRAIARIPDNIRSHVADLGLSLEPLERSIREIVEVVSASKTEDEEAMTTNDKRILAARALKKSGLLTTLRALLFQIDDASPTGILDLLSFDFVEALAIDGFHSNATVWQHQGSISQFLYGNSNGIINELMFDLRPVSAGSPLADGGLKQGEYSRNPDELGINVRGTAKFPASVTAVKYVPAVVFREYPYSIVNKYKVKDIGIIPEGADELSQRFTEDIFFGPIFAQGVNVPGRKIYEYPKPIAPQSCSHFKESRPLKHLDVVTITKQDVTSSNLGRSDEDLFNLFQLTPRGSGLLNQQFRSILTNFSPVINHVSVARNGLRVWEGTTQFANYAPTGDCQTIDNKKGGTPDSAAVRRNLVRWQLLLDHWYQHNVEYLSGTITLRNRPEIRPGYRLDWVDRGESYYVEGVTNAVSYPSAAQTTLQVVRGQRNDPFPVYIPPVFLNDANGVVTTISGDRSETGRLGKFFEIKDTAATSHSTQKTAPDNLGGNTVDMKGVVSEGGTVVFPATPYDLDNAKRNIEEGATDLGIDEDGEIV